MKPLTVYLGRLLGLFTLITSFWLLTERQNTLSTIPALLGDRPAMVIFAIIALAGGLAIVLAHNIWSGGVLPILVTLIGWVMLIRGVLFLFLPPEATLRILAAMQFERFFYIYLAIPFVLGLYLSYLAFTAHSRRE
jgi:1,4-dihydroxy-2-naphthoate octaprenyltransferase